VGESANLAFYAIVYAKGLVPRERLQDAMHRATLEGLAMESVLLQWGLLTQPQVDELVGVRKRLSRTCGACKKLTYLLQDQSEQSTPCEHCGGQLQPPARKSSRLRRPGHASTRTAARPPAAAAPDLEARIAKAEERILAKALESVETRLAQEDLTGFLKAVVKKASQAAVDAVAPQMQELQDSLTNAAPSESPSPELVQRVVAHVQAQLPAAPSSDDAAERATQGAIEAIQEYDLGSLPDRVAQQVLERLEAEEPSETLVQRVLAAVQSSGGGEAPELSEAHLQLLLNRVVEVLDTKISEPDGIAEHMAQHVLEKIPGLTSDMGPVDATVSEEDLARISAQAAAAATSQVEQQLTGVTDQVEQQLEAAMARVDQRVSERIEEALSGLSAQLAEGLVPQVVQAIEQRVGIELDQLVGVLTEQAVQQVELRSPPPTPPPIQPTIVAPPSSEVGEVALQDIMNTVETRLSEFDMAFDAVIMEATEKAVEAMDAKLANFQPPAAVADGAPPAVDTVEVTRQATGHVMRIVEERLAQLPGPGAGVDEERLAQQTAEQVLGVVEARLAGLEGGASAPAGAPADVDVDAIVARVSQQIMGEVEDRLRALPVGSAGTETSAPKAATGAYDRKFIALAREVKQLKDTVGKGGGGGGSVTRQGADLLNSEEFRSLLEARINQALASAGAGAVPGAKKGGELVGLLNTPEFKQVFDQKINQVLAYVKGDVIPTAVKKALREVESS
jgi:hypothetical protein